MARVNISNVGVNVLSTDVNRRLVILRAPRNYGSFKCHNTRHARIVGEALPSTNYPSVPGIMAFKTTIIPGCSEDNQSPINICAKNVYAYVRYVNSGHANYDPADLMMYILALDSAYTMVAWMRRIYGQLMLASQYNRYMLRCMIQSEGMDYDDLSQHIVDLRYFINQFQLKLGSFVIPKDFTFFTRHMWMFSNVYLDEPNQKAQMYKFVPDGFWRYVEDEGPGKLVFDSLTGVSTFADLVSYANTILNALASSEDCGIISGDILKAFGDDRIFKMDALLPEYLVLPVPNEEVLDQIQNLTITGPLLMDPNYDFRVPTIWQSTSLDGKTAGALMFAPYTLSLGDILYAPSVDRLISVDNPVPSPATTMVATRLLAMGEPETINNATYWKWSAIGSEMITGGLVYYWDKVSGFVGNYLDNTFAYQPRSIINYASWLNYIAKVDCFDRHPAFYLFTKDGNNSLFLSNLLFDISNYTFVSKDVMHRMHLTALLSMLNVPVMGSYATKLK
nr:putative capsid protein [Picobirnavirus sp.]